MKEAAMRSGPLRRIVIACIMAGAILVPLIAPPTFAEDPSQSDATTGGTSGSDNAVVLINTKDGRYLFRVGFKITRANGDVVDASNGAVAFSSCEECRTVAIAYQVVLVMSDPSIITPVNLAIAFNLECDTCMSFAYANQFVYSTGGYVRFTPEGSQTVARLRREVRDLRFASLTVYELVAILRDVAARLEQVVRTETVPIGPSKQEASAIATETPPALVSPTESPSATPSPSATVSADVTPSPSSTPSPSTTASPDASPTPSETPSPTP
jgi:putative peptide zinc metalloprotease protein